MFDKNTVFDQKVFDKNTVLSVCLVSQSAHTCT